MKKNTAFTGLVCFLAIILLFDQVALNLFHDKHDAHKSYQTLGSQNQLNSHGEHCKICGLDNLFHLYAETSPAFHFYRPEESIVPARVLTPAIAAECPVNGRAPPLLSDLF